jgi:hypothetical protein
MPRWIAVTLVAMTPLLVSSDASAGPPDPPANLYQLAAGYTAKETCSCSFVEGQTDAYCTNYGVSPTGENIKVTIDHTASTVTATFLGTTRTATFTAGQGCVLAGL